MSIKARLGETVPPVWPKSWLASSRRDSGKTAPPGVSAGWLRGIAENGAQSPFLVAGIERAKNGIRYFM
jgi:hypothetical protein